MMLLRTTAATQNTCRGYHGRGINKDWETHPSRSAQASLTRSFVRGSNGADWSAPGSRDGDDLFENLDRPNRRASLAATRRNSTPRSASVQCRARQRRLGHIATGAILSVRNHCALHRGLRFTAPRCIPGAEWSAAVANTGSTHNNEGVATVALESC